MIHNTTPLHGQMDNSLRLNAQLFPTCVARCLSGKCVNKSRLLSLSIDVGLHVAYVLACCGQS